MDLCLEIQTTDCLEVRGHPPPENVIIEVLVNQISSIPGPSKHPTYYDMSHFSHNLGGSAKLSIRSSSAGFFFTSHPPPPCTDCYASLASLIVHLCQVIVMVPSHMKEILKPLKTFFPQSPYSRMWARLQGVRGGLGGS